MLPLIPIGAAVLTLGWALNRRKAVKQPERKIDDKTVNAIDAEIRSQLPIDLSSPLDGVTDEQWTKFVNVVRRGTSGSISPNYQLGVFSLNMLQLADLGLTANPRKANYQGRYVWLADWRPGNSLKGFLSDPQLQYEQFARLTKAYSEVIDERYTEILGTEIEGVNATKSGLLAVCKHASLGGLTKWISEPTTRKESTTAVYKSANGIF